MEGSSSQTISRQPELQQGSERCLSKGPLMGLREPSLSCSHMHPDAHALMREGERERGNDQVQRIPLCYFIWQITEPYPCGLSEELHPYSCLAFPVGRHTPDFPVEEGAGT